MAPGACEEDSCEATQSSRQASWAVRAQGQGEVQREEVGESSVESAKQIQHLRGSESVGARAGGGGRVCCCEVAGEAEVGGVEEGVLRRRVWESSMEVVECGRLGRRI
jgi:hypothetical protein